MDSPLMGKCAGTFSEGGKMKFLFLSLATALFHLPTGASSPFLPISETNTFRSGERVVIEAAIAQAEAEQKPVLIEISAAWCGPCASLEKELKNREQEFQPLLSRFINVHVEEMHLETVIGMDFLPSELLWFPSFAIYNPANNKWSLIAATTADTLKATLNDYLSQPNLSKFYVDRVLGPLRAGQKISGDTVIEAVIPLSVEASGADYLAFVQELGQFLVQHPNQFQDAPDTIREYVGLAHLKALEMNKVTVEQLIAADPNAFPGLSTNYAQIHQLQFRIPLGYLIRSQGNVAAAAQCSALAAKAEQAVQGAPASIARKLVLDRTLQCLLLEVEVKTKKGADVQAFVATLSEQEKKSLAAGLMKVFALTGENFDSAIDHLMIWKQIYVNNFANKPEMLERVQKATDARLAAYRTGKTHP